MRQTRQAIKTNITTNVQPISENEISLQMTLSSPKKDKGYEKQSKRRSWKDLRRFILSRYYGLWIHEKRKLWRVNDKRTGNILEAKSHKTHRFFSQNKSEANVKRSIYCNKKGNKKICSPKPEQIGRSEHKRGGKYMHSPGNECKSKNIVVRSEIRINCFRAFMDISTLGIRLKYVMKIIMKIMRFLTWDVITPFILSIIVIVVVVITLTSTLIIVVFITVISSLLASS